MNYTKLLARDETTTSNVFISVTSEEQNIEDFKENNCIKEEKTFWNCVAKNVKCSNIFWLSFLSLFSHGFVGHFLLKAYRLLGSGKEKEGGLVLRSCFILFGLRLFYSVSRNLILHTYFVKKNL
jgi:hypothetical protein